MEAGWSVVSTSMPHSARCRAARLVALLLYALASATLGFAHRPAAATPPDLAQFVLPNGELPIICGKGNGGDRSGGASHLPICDACCLTAAPGLLLPTAVELTLSRLSTSIVWMRSQAVTQSFWTVVALGARGPPLT